MSSALPRFPLALTATAIGALALLNWLALNVPIETEAAPVPAASATLPMITAAQSPKREAAATQLRDMTERPLFHPDRRPAPAITARDDTPAAVTTNLELVGLMTDATGRQRALIRVSDEPASWVAVGERVVGWTVRSITAEQVIVEAQGRRSELQLYSR